MFFRKIYYDNQTGDVLYSAMRSGSVVKTTFEQDVEAIAQLNGRTKENTGCLEYDAPVEEIEAGLTKAASIRVDVSRHPHKLIFEDEAIPGPELESPDPETMEKTLNVLGVQTR